MSSGLTGPPAPDPFWNPLPYSRMRENPERLAWTVLLASFAVFLVLSISLPLTLRYWVEHATVRQNAVLDPTQGTILLYPPRSLEPIAISELRDQVAEGSIVEAGEGPTQATVRLISEGENDFALGSLQLFQELGCGSTACAARSSS